MSDQEDMIIVTAEAITKNPIKLVNREIKDLKEKLVFVKHTYEYMHKTLQALEENELQSKSLEMNNSYSYYNFNHVSNYIKFERADDISSDYELSSDYKDYSSDTAEDVCERRPKGISKMSLLSDKKKQRDTKYQISQPGDLFIERNMAVIRPTPSTSSIELSSSSDIEILSNYLPKEKRVRKSNDDNIENNDHIPIGLGNTIVSKEVYDEINWNSYTAATRKLLVAVFSKKVLATHSLTGKPSPAFAYKPAKLCLNPLHVADIIHEVTKKCNVKSNLVRIAITTKCADENKMMKMKIMKRNAN